VERFHKTLRAEWVRPNDRRFVTMTEAQASLVAWVEYYNTVRPHQVIGMVPPIERFRLAARRDTVEIDDERVLPAGPTLRGAAEELVRLWLRWRIWMRLPNAS
jgi:Integrase core domain